MDDIAAAVLSLCTVASCSPGKYQLICMSPFCGFLSMISGHVQIFKCALLMEDVNNEHGVFKGPALPVTTCWMCSELGLCLSGVSYVLLQESYR